MRKYEHLKLERRWQTYWEKKKVFQAQSPSPRASANQRKPKYYSLIEFPYPSGDGLHVGHPRPYIGMDVISRKRRMEGYNVLYPIGWDAFGLPTENYAIKTGKDPRIVTKKNSDNFRRQIKSLGISFDWSREVNTTDPKYYKWTQWIFLQFLKKGLAYKAKIAINWCPKDKIGLANEEVVGGACERCGTPVEKREKEQWMLAITKYAERLDKDLDTVDYLPQIKLAQRNWIGKSEGAEIEFHLTPSPSPYQGEGGRRSGEVIKVFTTRPDTIFGATFIAVAPEVAKKLTGQDFGIKTDTEKENKEKIGKDTGLRARNPATGEEIPIWVVNYVSADYGTGAIMAVPADDERDHEFAEKYNLPIVENYQKAGFKDFGKKITKFKLRDWVFSRQRYWGEPIPVIHCESCGIVPVPEKDLPVLLPKVKNYQPTESGESPLANISKWVNTTCLTCGGKAKRETDTMPNWAGSSWYFLRYTDPKNNKEFASAKNLKYWLMPPHPGPLPGRGGSKKVLPLGEDLGEVGGVDWYNGGMEHTTLHLLYSRFWHKFLYDLKLVPTSEPYMKRTSHGLILAEGGEKMSKSRGNVINPDDIVKRYGADTLRLYEMFMGPFDQAIAWSEEAIIGPRRFLEKVWRIGQSKFTSESDKSLKKILHKTIKKVSEDIEDMHFNTAISSLMIAATEMQNAKSVSVKDFKIFLQLISPFAPHIAEELWHMLDPYPASPLRRGRSKEGVKSEFISLSSWPRWDDALIKDEEVKIAVQVNGKVRTEIIIQAGDSEEKIKEQALSNQVVLKYTSGQSVKRAIYVKSRLINIVL